MPDSLLHEFVARVGCGDTVEALRGGLIGGDAKAPGPRGPNKLIYADYAASGRALAQVENFIRDQILPYYANAHTEASYCGAFINGVRREARVAIAEICGASAEWSVIFTGAGATSGINRLVHLLAVGSAPEPALVVLGPYEHHSNILPWRESGAEIVEISEAPHGGPDLDELDRTLKGATGRGVICALSAASNVTGIVTDVAAVNQIVKRYGAISVWDYAGGAPYLPIDVGAAGGLDAVVLSPHKFPGGPGASGVLIVRNQVVQVDRPSSPGGGTVSFVSPWDHHYVSDLCAREEAGTPNVIGDIRAGLALMLKAAVGDEIIAERNAKLCTAAFARWRGNDAIELLGDTGAERVPIFSFRVRRPGGGYVHHQLITRMLSDFYGVQARGGCACAGPYAHRLLSLSKAESDTIWQRLQLGHELEKPGWTRVNLSYLMDEDTVSHIIDAVDAIARDAVTLEGEYQCDPAHARFQHRAMAS